MSRTVDFTTWRKGTHTRSFLKIDYCPKCGRKGEVTKYKDGSSHVIHTGKVTGGAFMVEDSCLVPVEQEASP